MKKLILLITFLYSSLSPQTATDYNFVSVDSQLQWQKVFTNNISITDYNLYLKKNAADAYIESDVINFTKPFTSEALKPFGYKSGGFPTYMQSGGIISGIIEFKEGRNKVTITRIEVANALDPELTDDLSEFLIKKDEVKSKKHHLKVLNTLNQYFLSVFSNPKKDDW